MVRPITGSPHRVRESGHELNHPSHINSTFTAGKVRDVEFLVTARQVKGLSGNVSVTDLAHIKAQRASYIG